MSKILQLVHWVWFIDAIAHSIVVPLVCPRPWEDPYVIPQLPILDAEHSADLASEEGRVEAVI